MEKKKKRIRITNNPVGSADENLLEVRALQKREECKGNNIENKEL